MKMITENELVNYRYKIEENGLDNRFTLVFLKMKDCSVCEEFQPVYESVESLFPEMEFTVLEIEKPSRLPLFAATATPTIYLFVDGFRIAEYSGVADKAKLKEIIKSWVLG